MSLFDDGKALLACLQERPIPVVKTWTAFKKFGDGIIGIGFSTMSVEDKAKVASLQDELLAACETEAAVAFDVDATRLGDGKLLIELIKIALPILFKFFL